MATSAQIILRKKPNKQGQYPIAIRITKDRKSTYRHLGPYLDLEDWDFDNRIVKKIHPNHKSLNELIQNTMMDVNKGIINLETKDRDATVQYIRKEIYKSNRKLNFFEFVQEHLEELEISGKHNRLSSDRAYVGYLLKFNQSADLRFKEIDERFLRKLKIFLVKEFSLSQTSVMNVLVFVRLIYNKAIKDNLTKKKFYPFGAGKVKIKFPETEKIGLTAKEIVRIEQLEDLTPAENHARNVWLYCFNFAGIRVSDALRTRWCDIKDGRLYYRMGKNSKLLSLKLPDKVQLILKDYLPHKSNPENFIFPELNKANLKDSKDVFNKIKTANRKLN